MKTMDSMTNFFKWTKLVFPSLILIALGLESLWSYQRETEITKGILEEISINYVTHPQLELMMAKFDALYARQGSYTSFKAKVNSSQAASESLAEVRDVSYTSTVENMNRTLQELKVDFKTMDEKLDKVIERSYRTGN